MTNEFDNLPLTGVAVRLSLRDLLPIGTQLVVDLARELHPVLPLVGDAPYFEVPPGLSPDSVIVGGRVPSQSLFASEDNSLALLVQHNMIGARWTSGAAPYPRYEFLRKLLIDSIESISRLTASAIQVAVVNMSYTNVIKPATGVEQCLAYVDRTWVGDRLRADNQNVKEWMANVRLSSTGIDFKAEIAEGLLPGLNERVFQLSTSAGIFLPLDGRPFESLDQIHDALNLEFPSVISKYAKEQWGYVGNSDGPEQ